MIDDLRFAVDRLLDKLPYHWHKWNTASGLLADHRAQKKLPEEREQWDRMQIYSESWHACEFLLQIGYHDILSHLSEYDRIQRETYSKQPWV